MKNISNPNNQLMHKLVLIACCYIPVATPFLSQHHVFGAPGVFTSRPLLSTTATATTTTNLHVSLSTTWFSPSAVATATATTSTTTTSPAEPASGAFAFQDYEQQQRQQPESPSSLWAPQQAQRRRTSAISTKTTTRVRQEQFRLYCDLDGVLCDFESGLKALFPEHAFDSMSSFHIPEFADRTAMWDRIERADQPFFETLPWTAGGRRLWNAIAHLQPDILTGVPTYPQSRVEKLRWCHRELATSHNRQVHHIDMAGRWRSHVNVNNSHGKRRRRRKSLQLQRQEQDLHVITCWSDNKHFESARNAILIDDRECLRDKWEQKGGIFVHFNGNVDATLAQLREIGVDVQDNYYEDDDEPLPLLP